MAARRTAGMKCTPSRGAALGFRPKARWRGGSSLASRSAWLSGASRNAELQKLSWLNEMGLLGTALLLPCALYLLSHCRAGRIGNWVASGGVSLPQRSWAPDFFRLLCLGSQMSIHFLQRGRKDTVHPKYVELALRHLPTAPDAWSLWALLWLQRSIHLCASSGWFVLSAYLLSHQDVEGAGVAKLWLRKALRQAPAAILAGLIHAEGLPQLLESAAGWARAPNAAIRHEMACWLLVSLGLALSSKGLRFVYGLGLILLVLHFGLQSCRVHDLVTLTRKMTDQTSAQALMGELLPLYLLAFALSNLRPWRPLPPIVGLLFGVLGSGWLSTLLVSNVGGNSPPYMDPRLYAWVDLPFLLGTVYFLKSSETETRCSGHLMGVMASSSLMAQMISHRILLEWVAALRGGEKTSMVDALLSLPGFGLLSILLAYVMTVFIGIPGTWLLGKLVTPWFSPAANFFFAAYVLFFAAYMVFEEEVFSIAKQGMAFHGACPMAVFVKEPSLLLSRAYAGP
ncbi:hypothetical protein AK812_SmicGene11101 [Symbiodinium microadriaticum]|uniref:Uncharacterized protein n=1 Tax=Symbiodinium microadriaticum TaxID=2951 RepID=A0A1Q9EE03_SYMMI|nr:hypothetical protein AK812_SmicGene11101 [Symbiodinium microadriaticum]